MCACLMNIFCACPRRNKSRPGRSELLAFGCLLILHLILLLKNMSSFLQVVNFLTTSCLPEFCCKRLLQKSENFWQVGLQTPKALPEFCTFYMFCGRRCGFCLTQLATVVQFLLENSTTSSKTIFTRFAKTFCAF